MGLFVDLAEFTCFYQFLHDVIIKMFCFDLTAQSKFIERLLITNQTNDHARTGKNRESQLNQPTIQC